MIPEWLKGLQAGALIRIAPIPSAVAALFGLPAPPKSFLHGLFRKLCTDRFPVQRIWLFFIADRKGISV